MEILALSQKLSHPSPTFYIYNNVTPFLHPQVSPHPTQLNKCLDWWAGYFLYKNLIKSLSEDKTPSLPLKREGHLLLLLLLHNLKVSSFFCHRVLFNFTIISFWGIKISTLPLFNTLHFYMKFKLKSWEILEVHLARVQIVLKSFKRGGW